MVGLVVLVEIFRVLSSVFFVSSTSPGKLNAGIAPKWIGEKAEEWEELLQSDTSYSSFSIPTLKLAELPSKEMLSSASILTTSSGRN